MTPPAPARLLAYFAAKAPICVIARRGPTKYSQLILWYTDTDEFFPGQWIRGYVDHAMLSSDGRFMAIGLKRAKGRKQDQQLIVCRPPYFTALEVWIQPVFLGRIGFLKDDALFSPEKSDGEYHVVNALDECPLRRTQSWEGELVEDGSSIGSWRSGDQGRDQRGRMIRMEDGKVFVQEGEQFRLLFDANDYSFEPVAPPLWAKTWNQPAEFERVSLPNPRLALRKLD